MSWTSCWAVNLCTIHFSFGWDFLWGPGCCLWAILTVLPWASVRQAHKLEGSPLLMHPASSLQPPRAKPTGTRHADHGNTAQHRNAVLGSCSVPTLMTTFHRHRKCDGNLKSGSPSQTQKGVLPLLTPQRHFWWGNSLFLSPFSVSSFSMLTCFPGGASGKESACRWRRWKRHWFNFWVGKLPWRRAWQSTTLFLPEELDGQRSLADYSPWGCKELDTTEGLSTF